MDTTQKKNFTRISLEERKEIERLLKHGFSISAISRHIGRSQNPITVDVRRCGGKTNYSAEKAQIISDENRKRQITSGFWRTKEYIQEKLPAVKELCSAGKSFSEVRRILQISTPTLMHCFKLLGMRSENMFTMFEKMEDRIYLLEQQLEILFEKYKKDTQ